LIGSTSTAKFLVATENMDIKSITEITTIAAPMETKTIVFLFKLVQLRFTGKSYIGLPIIRD
jgi:hypothetical protein